MFRLSKYTKLLQIDDLHILYNMVSDSLIVVLPEIYELLRRHKNDLGQLEAIHPDLFNRLTADKMIVDGNADELEELIGIWKNEDEKPATVKLTVNPTLQCNLRCWYCYEDHSGKSQISAEVIESVKRLIDDIMSRKHVEKMVIDFFGGEPLLYFRQCVMPLVEYASTRASDADKSFGIAFTTNGILLTNAICDFLAHFGVPVNFQITLDGNRALHNTIRCLANGTGTFDTIVSNIKMALAKDFDVTVRFNYTEQNHESFRDVLALFADVPHDMRRHLSFSFHKVWQQKSTEKLEETVGEIKEMYLKAGMSVNQTPEFVAGRCYADSNQNIVVNFDGNVFKCTARDFKPENAEGRLLPSGKVEWNRRNEKRNALKYGTATCRECSIFPLCHNGCSQDKMEQAADSGECPRGFVQETKDEAIKLHVLNMLKSRFVPTVNNNF